MNETPSPERLQKLPAWAQEYVAWLREQLAKNEHALSIAYRHIVDDADKTGDAILEMERKAPALAVQMRLFLGDSTYDRLRDMALPKPTPEDE